MTTPAMPLSFDYSALDPDTALFLHEAAARVGVRDRYIISAGLDAVLANGRDLAAARDALRHDKAGGFDGWLAHHGLERRTAYRYIAAHERFGNRDTVSRLPIAPTAVYVLSSPRAPEAAREQAVAMAEAGQVVTPAVARTLVLAHSPRERPAPRGRRDAVGLRVPPHLARAFANAADAAALAALLADALEMAERLAGRPGLECFAARFDREEEGLSCRDWLAALAEGAAGCEPHCSRCPPCLQGAELYGDTYPSRECPWCRGRGWLSRAAWEALGGDSGGITAHYLALWRKDGELR